MNKSSMEQRMDNIICTDRNLMEKADALFRFVMRYHDYAMEKKDYGTHERVSMVDAHTLMEIADCPGVTVSALARRANRTKGAISQTIKRLDEMGYIERSKTETDQRVIGLYPTARGLELHQAHRKYDYNEMHSTYQELLQYCSMEELEAFFRVVNAYITLFAS